MRNETPKKRGIIHLFQSGKRYMDTWPSDKRLAVIFPENRVIKVTRFAIRFMPAIAAFTLVWQIALGGELGPEVATALFACSLPLQGLAWLGDRALTPLPPQVLKWFYELREKLITAGQTLAPLEKTPTYQSLAEVLKRGLKQLDHSFFDNL